MLYQSKLPLKFWAEAVNTMVYLRNRSPTTALNGSTPFEFWYQKKPDVSNLRVFGSICYVHIPDVLRKKLDPKSYKAVFLGYPEGTKGYKVYDVEKQAFNRSHSVIFHEGKFHDFESVDDPSGLSFPEDTGGDETLEPSWEQGEERANNNDNIDEPVGVVNNIPVGVHPTADVVPAEEEMNIGGN